MFTRRWRTTAALVLALMVCMTISGCGGSILRTALTIKNAVALLPSNWSSSGGWVKVLADITGYTDVTRVIAFVKKLGSSESHQVELVPTADGRFECTFEAEENTSAASAEQYDITVTATDPNAGAAESEPVTVEVPPAENPTTPEVQEP